MRVEKGLNAHQYYATSTKEHLLVEAVNAHGQRAKVTQNMAGQVAHYAANMLWM